MVPPPRTLDDARGQQRPHRPGEREQRICHRRYQQAGEKAAACRSDRKKRPQTGATSSWAMEKEEISSPTTAALAPEIRGVERQDGHDHGEPNHVHECGDEQDEEAGHDESGSRKSGVESLRLSGRRHIPR
jgi:hypothetical protein